MHIHQLEAAWLRTAGAGANPGRTMMRQARTLLARGFLHGALLYGAVLSLLHVVHNRLTSPLDGVIVLAVFALLYGSLSAAAFAAAGLTVAAGMRLRPGAGEGDAGRPAVVAGLFAFAFPFWFLVLNYGLTYDEVPFGPPRGVGGMLAYLALRTLLLALATIAVAPRLATLLAWLAERHRVTAVALVVAGVHLGLPLLFRHTPIPAVKPAEAPQSESVRADPEGRKVILLGFDGADWRVIEPLLRAGRLPHFARLMREGSYGPLATLADANSAMIWASIYTGMPVARHGIEDFYRIRLPGMTAPGLFPVHRTFFKELAGYLEPLGITERQTMHRGSMRALPIWEVLDRIGVSIGVIDGFYVSYPAPALRDGGSYFLAYGLATRYQRLVRHGGRPGSEALRSYVEPHELLEEVSPYLEREEAAWQSGTLLDLLRRRAQPRFLSLYTHQPDTVQHAFWKWYEPQRFLGAPGPNGARLGARIPETYVQLDELIGGVLARGDPDTVVMVISDHGHSPTILHATYTQHRHGPPGILLLAGGPVRRGYRLDRAYVLDIFPTVLHLLGLPVPEGGAGRVLTEALEPAALARLPVRTTRAYAALVPEGGPMEEDRARNREEIEKLRALGYIR
jgi:hypothetical protein